MAHAFAFFLESFGQSIRDNVLVIEDVTLVHRISLVLRLKIGEKIILFDRNNSVSAVITIIDKKIITVQAYEYHVNNKIKPFLTVCLPLLKKEDLELAIDGLAQVGVSVIQLITTEKCHPNYYSPAYHARLERLIIAAAEQSKHFHFPVLHPPKSFAQLISSETRCDLILHADVDGTPFHKLISEIVRDVDCRIDKPILLFVGPEGDFSQKEKQDLQQKGAISFSITPTVLRACTAVIIAAGMLRIKLSGLNEKGTAEIS